MALSLRKRLDLGIAELAWDRAADGEDRLAFVSRDPAGARNDVLVLTTFDAPAEIGAGWDVILTSQPIADGVVPPNTTIWASRA